jgi:acyl carrier protein
MIDKDIIREFLITLVGKDVPFEDEDSLISNHLIDSLSVVRLIVFLQDTFSIEFEADELSPENLDSLAAITRFLESKGLKVSV